MVESGTKQTLLYDYSESSVAVLLILVLASKTAQRVMMDIVSRLKEFLDNEARSCSMDYGCVNPIYVYRMWGGQVPLNEIEEAMKYHVTR